MEQLTNPYDRGGQREAINLNTADCICQGKLASGVVQTIAVPEGAEIIINGSNDLVFFTYGDAPANPVIPVGILAFNQPTQLMPLVFYLNEPAGANAKMKLIAPNDTNCYLDFRTR